MCLILHQGGKWQNKPILRPYYIYGGGQCFRKTAWLRIEILFWQQTCCSQPPEWLKPVRKYHRSPPARMLHSYEMCKTTSETTQNKNILHSVKPDRSHLRKNNKTFIPHISFSAASAKWILEQANEPRAQPKWSRPYCLKQTLPNQAFCHFPLRI